MNFSTIAELDNHIISSKISKSFNDYIDYLKDINNVDLDMELLNLYNDSNQFSIDNATLLKYTGISLEDSNLLEKIKVKVNVDYVDNKISKGGFKTVLFSCKEKYDIKKQFLFIENSYISYILCDNKVKDSQINDLTEQLKNFGILTSTEEVAGGPPPKETKQTNQPTDPKKEKESPKLPKGDFLSVVYDPTGLTLNLITGKHQKVTSTITTLLTTPSTQTLIEPSRYESTFLSYLKRMIKERVKEIKDDMKSELLSKKESGELDFKDYRTKAKEIVDMKLCNYSPGKIELCNPELLDKDEFLKYIKECLKTEK